MRLRISIRGCVRPSVRPSVRPQLFSNADYGCFEGEKSSTDIVNNGKMSDDVVASDVPPRYLFIEIERFEDVGKLARRPTQRTRSLTQDLETEIFTKHAYNARMMRPENLIAHSHRKSDYP